MIAPLYVPRVILTEGVHNLMRASSAVVDIAEDMQLVDGQTLNDVTDGADKVVGAPCRDDGIHDDGHIGGLVDVVGTLMKQFLDDVREILRQRLTNLASGVFR